MYIKRRSWNTFGACVLVSGLALVGLGIAAMVYSPAEQNRVPMIIVIAIGSAIASAGIGVLMWRLKKARQEKDS